MPADLHVHSTASDGKLKPEEIIRMALAAGLRYISLTDHDTVDGIYPALESSYNTDIEVIPGIEFNTDLEGHEIHILGYYIDFKAEWFQEALKKLKIAREKRARAIIDRLSSLGIKISYNKIKEIAGFSPIGRPHIAQALINAGYVASVEEAFGKYVGYGKAAYVSHHKIDPFRAIELIQKAKGIPVLAHPGLLQKDEFIPMLVKKGILGIEVYYPLHTNEMVDRYKRYCRKYGLIITGGSDYHGPGLKYPTLGTVTVPDDSVKHLKILHQELLRI